MVSQDFFEGVEKVLRISYDVPGRGLLELSREDWDQVLNTIGAKILSTTSDGNIVSYVLSESSLFVWRNSFLLKTCGTTCLLASVPVISQILKNYFVNFEVTNVLFCHKGFIRPEEQLYPHRNYNEENDFLLKYFPSGKTFEFSLDSHEKSHWMAFLYEKVDNFAIPLGLNEIRIEINMHDLDGRCFEMFSRNSYQNPDSEMGKGCGIHDLLPTFLVDEASFDPWGYSVNGVQNDRYFTIHVTPQHSCSYASFETNINARDGFSVSQKALAIFKPQNFVLTVVYLDSQEQHVLSYLEEFNKRFTPLSTQVTKSGAYYICYNCY